MKRGQACAERADHRRVALTHIRLRWQGTCAGCRTDLVAGSWAFHDRAARTVHCAPCIRGVPGRSARRRYDALVARRGDLPDAQHVTAWKTGAEGEEWLAARLAKLLDGHEVHLLHDRRIPGSRANIDHLAVGPGGVTVIDPKNVRGRVRVRRWPADLRVNGRDRMKYVEGMEWQVGEVSAALEELGHQGVPIAGVLCFVQPVGLPVILRARIRGVAVVGPRATARIARRSGSLGPDAIRAIRDGLACRLPPC